MPLVRGQVIQNRYRIVKPLGQGGMGAVYRAWDLNVSAPCALKENLDTSAEATRQFAKEASILANLRHPNLPRVTDHFTIPGEGQYLVMDFIEGTDLGEMLIETGQPLAEAQVLTWMRQICEALSYLHSQKPPIIHRDIKPANIRITPQRQAILVDFGIAKVYDPVLKTTMGARAVTPGFSPFEQYGQSGTDARSDVYALGATMYNLLTGQEPPESIDRVRGTQLPAPRSLNPKLTAHTERVILKAMALQPDDRYQSIQEMRTALTPQPVTPVTPHTPHNKAAPPTTTAFKQVPGWLWGIVGLLIGIIGFGACSIMFDPIGSLAIAQTATPTVTYTPQPTPTEEPTATPIPPTPTAIPRIAFYSYRDGNNEIYVMNADGSEQINLTNHSADDYYPAWSPDGTGIAFYSERDGNREIYVMNVMNTDGSEQTNLTNHSADDYSPAWSLDSTRIAFNSNRDGNDEIYVMNADGSGQTNLTNHSAGDYVPAWSPDGMRIAFYSLRDGNREIYVMNTDGSEQTNLTNHSADDRRPAWSPDGTRIAFQSNRDGNWEIYVMNADGSGQTNLINHSANDYQPAWSPDGTRIVFASDRNGNNWEIYVMNVDGSGQTNLTNHPATDSWPTWSP